MWPVKVFAVDDCSAQLTWSVSPPSGLVLQVGDMAVRPLASPPAEVAVGRPLSAGEKGGWVRHGTGRYWSGRRLLDPAFPGGPGSVVIDGLAPATEYEVMASAAGVAKHVVARFRTLRPPDGGLLTKFATVSDLHIGERRFGVAGRLHDPNEPAGPEPYPARALQAAMEEAAAWGAQLIVAKGDLTNLTTPTEVRDAGHLLANGPIPVEALLGNHDNNARVNVRALLSSSGINVPWQPWARDLEGIRLVLASTDHGKARYHRGQLRASTARKIAQLVSDAGGAAWVGLHHPPERYPFPTVYPPGIPFGESRFFFEELARVGAAGRTFVSCGHRHRNRSYLYRGVVVTEVGSTKDYPGVWAGYKVFEGGILQVVRRVARPDVLSWTESTRRAMNGQWGRWSPGRLRDRCLVHTWSWA